jgi:hypothetical protein
LGGKENPGNKGKKRGDENRGRDQGAFERCKV